MIDTEKRFLRKIATLIPYLTTMELLWIMDWCQREFFRREMERAAEATAEARAKADTSLPDTTSPWLK